jgi:hypothetical protein
MRAIGDHDGASGVLSVVMRRRLLLPLLVLVLAAVAVPAFAATRNGVTPTSPKQGTQLSAGEAVTFAGRVSGSGSVWIRVCKSGKRNAAGLICAGGLQTRAKRDGSRWRVTPTVYDFPGYWANTPGRWYWQAHRVFCDTSGRNCAKAGPVQTVRVR